MEITRELIQIFANWTKLKIRIHVSEPNAHPKPRGIWWVSLGQNIGVETNGKNEKFERPVLVIKVFNRFGVLVAPISSVAKRGKYFIEFTNNEGKINIINMSQLRSISGQRFVRYIDELSSKDFEKVKQMYSSFV